MSTWPALGLAALVTGASAVSSFTRPAESVVPLLFALGLLAGSFARWRRLPTPVGHVALASVVALGAWRTVGGIAELIAGG